MNVYYFRNGEDRLYECLSQEKGKEENTSLLFHGLSEEEGEKLASATQWNWGGRVGIFRRQRRGKL